MYLCMFFFFILCNKFLLAFMISKLYKIHYTELNFGRVPRPPRLFFTTYKALRTRVLTLVQSYRFETTPERKCPAVLTSARTIHR